MQSKVVGAAAALLVLAIRKLVALCSTGSLPAAPFGGGIPLVRGTLVVLLPSGTCGWQAVLHSTLAAFRAKRGGNTRSNRSPWYYAAALKEP